jgi:hypothetical protein
MAIGFKYFHAVKTYCFIVGTNNLPYYFGDCMFLKNINSRKAFCFFIIKLKAICLVFTAIKAKLKAGT